MASVAQDFIEKYIESEKAKFGRELTLEEAELEVDAWLLKCAAARRTQRSEARAAAGGL